MKKFVFLLMIVKIISLTCFAEVEIPKVDAMSACAVDADNGEILYYKMCDMKLPMASTTKIMTAIIAIENSNVDDVVTISNNAILTEGSSAYLKPCEKTRMENILYGLMLNSGNDAAVAIAEHISGSEERFAELMNEKARQIGMVNTHYDNASGLDGENHYTTAYDLAKLTAYALNNDTFKCIVSCKEKSVEYNDRAITYRNHNKLLWRYDGVIGVKTGFTKKSGRCLVSAAQRNGKTVVVVTLNDANDWEDHIKMFDFSFSNMKNINVITHGDMICKNKIQDREIDCFAECDVIADVFGSKNDFEIVSHTNELEMPIRSGDKVGYAEVMYKGKTVGRTDLFCKENIDEIYKKRNIKDIIIYILRCAFF